MSAQGDFFNKFISAKNYKIQRGIYKVMTELDAYETPITTGRNTTSNYNYLRALHMTFFGPYQDIVDRWRTNGNLEDDLSSLRQIVQDILRRKQQLRQQELHFIKFT